MLGTVLSLSLSSAREVRTSSLWWLSLGPHHRAHSRTGSSCRTEAGFPIVWCWNIPQDGPESLKIHGFGPMPAFSLSLLGKSQELIKGPTVSGPCFQEVLELLILSTYIYQVSPQVCTVLLASLSVPPCMFALWSSAGCYSLGSLF